MPIAARSVGCHRSPEGFEERLHRPFAEFLWGVGGKGGVIWKGRFRPVQKGQVVVLPPGTIHNLIAYKPYWEFYWWTMDGPLIQAVLAALGIKPGHIY